MNLLNRRRMMFSLLGGGGGLPAEYQEVMWINGNGAYIDTGIIPPLESVLTFVPYGNYNYGQTLISAYQTSARYFLGYADNVFYSDWDNNTGVDVSYIVSGHKYEFYRGRLTDLDTHAELTPVKTSNPSFQNLCILGRPNGTWLGSTQNIGKVTLKNGADMLLDLVPCRRKSDNVAGMYDMVSHVFYTSANSASFVAGPDVSIPYVTEGLVAWWDGFSKGGGTTSWIDAVGGFRMDYSSGVTPIEGGFYVNNGQFYHNGTLNTSIVQTIEVVIKTSSSIGIFFMPKSSGQLALGIGDIGLIWTTGSAQPAYNKSAFVKTEVNAVSVSTERCVVNLSSASRVASSDNWGSVNGTAYISGRGAGSSYKITGEIYCVRLYDRALTEEEMMRNQQVDRERFGLTF